MAVNVALLQAVIGHNLILLGRPAAGAAMLAGAICAVVGALACLLRREGLLALAILGLGLTFAANGVSWIFDDRTVMFGAMGVFLGATISAIAMGHFRDDIGRAYRKMLTLFEESEVTGKPAEVAGPIEGQAVRATAP